MNSLVGLILIVISLAVGFIKGYNTGYTDGDTDGMRSVYIEAVSKEKATNLGGNRFEWK